MNVYGMCRFGFLGRLLRFSGPHEPRAFRFFFFPDKRCFCLRFNVFYRNFSPARSVLSYVATCPTFLYSFSRIGLHLFWYFYKLLEPCMPQCSCYKIMVYYKACSKWVRQSNCCHKLIGRYVETFVMLQLGKV